MFEGPLSLLSMTVLIAALLALFWSRLPRGLCYLGLAVEVALLLLMAPLGANVLVRVLESQVPPPQSCKAPTPDVIVVLSAGFDRAPGSADDFSALGEWSLRRLFAGVALSRRTSGARLVVAGGGPYKVAESAVLARLAQQLGLPVTAIRTEPRSQTTWENAQYLAAMSPPLPKRIWLVSSALHLPRALVAFRAAGFEPCAYASDYRYVAGAGVGYFIPQSSSLVKANAAIHELIGGWVYDFRAHRTAHRTTQPPIPQRNR